MPRWFNIAGPCQDDIHYMLSPTARLPDLMDLIQQRSYFVVHAPRQTGKTTAMLALAQQLTLSGRYTAVVVSAEVGSAFNNDIGAAELAIVGTWHDTIADVLPKELQAPVYHQEEPGRRIRAYLRAWAQASPRPLIVFIDEIDSLQNEIEREYAIGRDRMDLCLRYRKTTLGIELKVWRDKKGDPEAEGIEQLDEYLARIEVKEGWLFVFDRRKNAPPFIERLFTKTVTTQTGRSIIIQRA